MLLDNFRSHEVWCAHARVRPIATATRKLLGAPKVRELHKTGAIHQDVVALDVSVDDVVTVQVAQPSNDLERGGMRAGGVWADARSGAEESPGNGEDRGGPWGGVASGDRSRLGYQRGSTTSGPDGLMRNPQPSQLLGRHVADLIPAWVGRPHATSE